MYSRFQLAKKYLHYYFSASNGKGHGIHSPFVYEFTRKVLMDDRVYEPYPAIETQRKALLANRQSIPVEDFGAGSSVIKTKERAVNRIAASSLKPAKFAQLLFRIVKHYQPQQILELGTSFGITTAYLAAAAPGAKVFTAEGAASVAGIARENFDMLALSNIELIEGDFRVTLPSLLERIKRVDLAFIDGNHRKEPTLDYFQQILKYSHPSTILIFDDIHWSAEMESAWETIRQDPAVTLSIDLFFIGILFFNPDINHKQDFCIRF